MVVIIRYCRRKIKVAQNTAFRHLLRTKKNLKALMIQNENENALSSTKKQNRPQRN